MINDELKKKHDEMFKECIDLMREPISKMGDKYPLEIINASLLISKKMSRSVIIFFIFFFK